MGYYTTSVIMFLAIRIKTFLVYNNKTNKKLQMDEGV